MWRLLKGVLAAAMMLFIGEIIVLLGSRSTFQDPFVPYQIIMPGQQMEAVMGFPCRVLSTSNVTEGSMCEFEAADPIFAKVTVIYSKKQIEKIIFAIESTTFY